MWVYEHARSSGRELLKEGRPGVGQIYQGDVHYLHGTKVL